MLVLMPPHPPTPFLITVITVVSFYSLWVQCPPQ